MDSPEADEARQKSTSGTLLGVFRHGSCSHQHSTNVYCLEHVWSCRVGKLRNLLCWWCFGHIGKSSQYIFLILLHFLWPETTCAAVIQSGVVPLSGTSGGLVPMVLLQISLQSATVLWSSYPKNPSRYEFYALHLLCQYVGLNESRLRFYTNMKYCALQSLKHCIENVLLLLAL